jgi:hypothetical protein
LKAGWLFCFLTIAGIAFFCYVLTVDDFNREVRILFCPVLFSVELLPWFSSDFSCPGF